MRIVKTVAYAAVAAILAAATTLGVMIATGWGRAITLQTLAADVREDDAAEPGGISAGFGSSVQEEKVTTNLGPAISVGGAAFLVAIIWRSRRVDPTAP